jgi:hypothetical protein
VEVAGSDHLKLKQVFSQRAVVSYQEALPTFEVRGSLWLFAVIDVRMAKWVDFNPIDYFFYFSNFTWINEAIETLDFLELLMRTLQQGQ